MKKKALYFLLLLIILDACHSKTNEEGPTEEKAETITPVTVTSLSTEAMTDYIELNATSAFLRSAVVKASANGYVVSVDAHVGKIVSAEQVAFVIRTKESHTLGNTINLLDSTFKFSGTINIKAGTTGYVSAVSHQAGDYVQEGEQLATINDVKSFVFILNVPYELRPYVMDKSTVDLYLPDGKTMTGHISSAMPVVDSASQTLNIVLTVSEKNLPENLIAKVKVVKTAKTNAPSLPKEAILSDETQSNFWVMKLIDDSTAVKVAIKKGLQVDGRIGIDSPAFLNSDRFLVTGNYGLSDTAKVKIVK